MREAPNVPSPAPVASAPRRGGRVTDRILPPEQRQAPPESFLRRTMFPYIERMTEAPRALSRFFNEDDIRVRLLRAGFPFGIRAATFRVIKVIGVLIGALLFAVYFPIVNIIFQPIGFGLPGYLFPFWVALGVIYGFRLPDIWLGMQITRRRNEIQMVLPDMIDLISISVEAGLGLMMAIQRISERFPSALAEEFLRTLQEVRLGRDQPNALRDMARRVDLDDLTTLLTAIVQAEVLGLAVSNVLRVQSERLREKRSQRAREAAQKAPIKMTFPLVLFIFPALFLIILGPAMIKIFLQQGAF